MAVPPAEGGLDHMVELAEMEAPGDDELAPDRRLDAEQGDAELHGGRLFPGHAVIVAASMARRQLGTTIKNDNYRRGSARFGLGALAERGAAAIALGVELEHGGMVDKAVDRRDRHRRVGKD